MSDCRLDLLLHLAHKNEGKLSRTKHAQFGEITDRELERIETMLADAFEFSS